MSFPVVLSVFYFEGGLFLCLVLPCFFFFLSDPPSLSCPVYVLPSSSTSSALFSQCAFIPLFSDFVCALRFLIFASSFMFFVFCFFASFLFLLPRKDWWMTRRSAQKWSPPGGGLSPSSSVHLKWFFDCFLSFYCMLKCLFLRCSMTWWRHDWELSPACDWTVNCADSDPKWSDLCKMAASASQIMWLHFCPFLHKIRTGWNMFWRDLSLWWSDERGFH